MLHGLEADIKGGASTITDPQFLEDGQVKKFSLVMANFPFSDDFWWLRPEQQTDDKKKKDKLKKEVFGKEGYKDPFGRFGRGTPFKSPPAAFGDYAFVLHILASFNERGRGGIVCPQGVLFRGQPEVEEETGEFDDEGNPKIKRRKADDEHLIRQALLDSRLVDAVISLPLNIFYGAGVPACLLILRKERPAERRDKVLLIYAARHFRELSNQNELRPQDVMRLLVHYHAYGDGAKVTDLISRHSNRIREQITEREREEVERLEAEYQPFVDKLEKIEKDVADLKSETTEAKAKEDQSNKFELVAPLSGGTARHRKRPPKGETKNLLTMEKAIERKIEQLEKQRAKLVAKIAERDERIAETRRQAEDDRQSVVEVGEELAALYADPNELLKQARVVDLDEIRENEYNLNIPRYVDTFEPEPLVQVKDALKALEEAEAQVKACEHELRKLLREIGYAQQQ